MNCCATYCTSVIRNCYFALYFITLIESGLPQVILKNSCFFALKKRIKMLKKGRRKTRQTMWTKADQLPVSLFLAPRGVLCGQEMTRCSSSIPLHDCPYGRNLTSWKEMKKWMKFSTEDLPAKLMKVCFPTQFPNSRHRNCSGRSPKSIHLFIYLFLQFTKVFKTTGQRETAKGKTQSEEKGLGRRESHFHAYI